MKLHKFLLTPPIVAISAALFCSALFAEGPKTWIGGESSDWNVPENWDPVGIPDSSDDVMVVGADVTLTGPIDVNSLTVIGAAKLTVKAVGLSDEELAVFSTLETDLAPIAAKLWERATVVNVRHNFAVEDGATVIPDADKVTGVPVIFKVGGNFKLDEESSFNAVERGWGWTVGTDYPTYARKNLESYKYYAWSYAPGCGYGYSLGGAYGGSGTSPATNGGMKYGYSYGSAIAPFLPGSNGGYHFISAANIDNCRGGGAIVIFTTGEATIDGLLDASSVRRDSAGSSGGGIWLTAATFTFGATAKLDAHGGSGYNYSGQGAAGGGRIALAEGYTWADIETAAGGVMPEGFVDAGTIRDFEVATDVAGGIYSAADKKYESKPGTLSYVRSATAPVKVVVTIDGDGAVICDGTAYTEDFTLTVPANEDLTLTAEPTATSAFGGWFGDVLPGGSAKTAALTFAPPSASGLRVVFASTVPTARAWAGTKSSDWFDGANWTPAGVPGPNDDVTITGGKTVLDCSVSLKSLTLTAAAELTVGSKEIRGDATLTTSGDLTVAGGSKLTVYAGTLADLSVFASLNTDLAPIAAALWNAAKIVTVGGDLKVTGAGSTVSPDADKVTGVPVVFKVGGDFTLGEGASFNAVERGWGWTVADTTLAGAKKNSGGVTPAWSFAPGSGRDYMVGGGYGGQTPKAGAWNGDNYGYSYGSAIAPFLPGSNGGLYQLKTAIEQEQTRGGGAVVVFAAGQATIDGLVDVSSTYHDHSGASGGGIWLTAEKFTFGANAFLDAHGGYTKGYEGGGVGGGGRIALAEGYTWADIETAAGGSIPEGFVDAGTIAPADVKTDVAGGAFTGTGKKYDPYPGTLSFVRSAVLPVNLHVTIDGEGSVTYDGTTYTSTFDVTVPVKETLTLTAAAGEGSQFVSWGGAAIPGGACEVPELSLALEVPIEITVSFVRGTIVRTWVGGKDGDWAAPLNWSPIGVPREADDVVIGAGLVRSLGAISVRTLTLSGTAVLSNAAVAAEGDGSAANLAAGATVFRVSNALRLEDSATLIPANELKTGAPVRYEVGSLYVGEGARIDASGQGWGWFESADDPYATLTQGAYKTRAPGAGGDDKMAAAYNRGGAYGALGGNPQAPYGQPYGSEYAPLLPGSPNGLYNFVIGNMRLPGGTVWVKCGGLMELYGTIASDGKSGFYGSPSGGGVWLCAKGVKAASTASVTANGGYLENSGYVSVASGGRIALAIGLTDAQMASLVDGEDPAALGLEVQEGIDLFTATARGGLRAGATPFYGNDGTVRTLIGSEGYVNVTIAGSPVAALGTEPANGIQAYEKGSVQTFTAPEYGVDPVDPAVRYACAGYVVTGAGGEIKRGEGRSVSVTIEGATTVTWNWGAAERRALVRKPEHGSLTVDGVAVDGDAIGWTAGRMAPVAAVPDEGYEFVCWEGVLPLGCATQNPLAADLEKPLDVTPVFRLAEEPTMRTWNGTGDWKDAAKWTPAGNIPGTGDTVVIAGGVCTVSNALIAAALRVTGGTLDVGRTAAEGNAEIVVAGDAELSGGTVNLGAGARYVQVSTGGGRIEPVALWKGHGRIAVGGDLTLGGAAQLAVMGGPVGGEYTFASGCSLIEVGGALALNDTAVLALYSEFLSGGSVKVTAKTVAVAEGAKVDACGKGYMWLDDNTPPDAPGIGYSYFQAASHGGIGGSSDDKKSPAYGFQLSPVQPGSPNGSYSSSYKPGGGLIRIHAETMSVDGTLDANAFLSNVFGGPSGGGIWLTARDFAFGPKAVLTVRGGACGSAYASYGAGGRIAICRNMNDDQLASLAETGTWRGFRPRKLQTVEAFRELVGNDTMTIDVRWGGETVSELEAQLPAAQARLDAAKAEAARPDLTPEQKKAADAEVTSASGALNNLKTNIKNEPSANGTFAYVDGTIPGLMLLVK